MKSVVIVGAGSYVIGDSLGIGVILPSLLNLVKNGKIKDITIAIRRERTESELERIEQLIATFDLTGSALKFVQISGPQDIHGLLDRDKLMFIAVPDQYHAVFLEQAIGCGTPTWIVKPATGDGQTSIRLGKRAWEKKLPIWVDYHKRFDHSNLMLKQIVDDGKMGPAVLYSVQYSQPHILPLQDLRAWAGSLTVLQYIGCHYLDQIEFLFNPGSVRRLSATGMGNYLRKHGIDQDDVIHCILDVEHMGQILRCDLNIAWNDPLGTPAKSHQRVELQLEHGRVIADQKVRGFQEWSDTKFNERNPYFFNILKDPVKGTQCSGYGFASIEHFVDVHADDSMLERRELPWLWNVSEVDLLLDYAHMSLKNKGAWVEVAG